MVTLRATCSPAAGDVMLTTGAVESDCAATGDGRATARAAAITIRAAMLLAIGSDPNEQRHCHVQDSVKHPRQRGENPVDSAVCGALSGTDNRRDLHRAARDLADPSRESART